MTCEGIRAHLLDLNRDRISPALRRTVEEHVASCPACARASAAEAALDDALERRLPRYPAPPALKRRLAALAAASAGKAEEAPPAARRRRWARALAPALAAGFALATATLLVERAATSRREALATLTGEAVNDYLRVLQREGPQLESSGSHQVKPWFEGKLDFAPAVPAPVVADMRLEGGSIGYFLDRKAAVIVYGLRRHAVTLLVFRADGLDWPRDGRAKDRAVARGDARGFHVFLWRAGGLGYALVSDAAPEELSEIAAKLAAST